MYGVCCRLEGTVDSIPQGLIDGRPASSLVLTHHQVLQIYIILSICPLSIVSKYNCLKQYQQLQHIQAQQEQAAAGGLTLTLHHQTTVNI